MGIKSLERSLWQRIIGSPVTQTPGSGECWQYSDGILTINLSKAPELVPPGSSLRFEGGNLPCRVLVIHTESGEYKAFHNRCTHFGHRRLDYVPGTDTVQCCSINKSTYTFAGEKIYGPNKKPVETFPVDVEGNELMVRL